MLRRTQQIGSAEAFNPYSLKLLQVRFFYQIITVCKSAGLPTDKYRGNAEMDGKIFVEPNKKAPDETLYECRLRHNSNKEGRRLRVIRKLAEWTEPLTNPQSRAECLKMCSIAPWDKWCLGWKLGWQWLSCKLYLEVSVGAEREQDIFEAVECALEDEAVQRAAATIVAAISEEGVGLVAAKEDFVAAFKAAIDRSRSDVSAVQLCQSCGWGDADEAPKLVGA
jgi:hypothetical protein